jgi:2-dehydro-3-deoxygluconokinase
MKRIACIGECMLELAPEGTAEGPYRLGVAGDTYNTAVYMGRLLAGSDARVWYVTALGDDTLSERIVKRISAEGLDSELVWRLRGRMPGLYMIETDRDGERRFHYWRSASAAKSLLDDGRDLELERRLGDFDLIYLSGISLAILSPEARDRLLIILEGLGDATRVVFDPNFRPALWPGPEEAADAAGRVAAMAAMVLSTLDDDRLMFGAGAAADALETWRNLGAREVAVKDGGAGCLATDGKETLHVAAVDGVRSVDTTGAGDAFNAGYIAARVEGRDIAAAAALGHKVAARVVATPGAILPRAEWDAADWAIESL